MKEDQVLCTYICYLSNPPFQWCHILLLHVCVWVVDDELLDVNGVSLKGMSVTEVGAVIRSCPQEFLATVRPVSALKKYRTDAPRGSYARRMANFNTFTHPVSTPVSNQTSNHYSNTQHPTINTPSLSIRPPTPDHTPSAVEDDATPPPDFTSHLCASDEGSLCSSDDMGDYDDEHEDVD